MGVKMEGLGERAAGLTKIGLPDGIGFESDNGVAEIIIGVGAAVALAIFAWRRGGSGKGKPANGR